MSAGFDSIDLARFALRPGEGQRLDVETDPGELELAGQRYVVGPDAVPVRLDLSRTAAGYAVRMRFTAHATGPCMRCLEDADVAVEIDAREVDQPGTDDEELRSPYVDGDELALGSWAHDALSLEVPIQLLCRPDCPGLCPVCGEPLSAADGRSHEHEREPDPRWAKLRELN
ncbi:MAG: YceD family protein [Solirubrobacterales bacterium]